MGEFFLPGVSGFGRLSSMVLAFVITIYFLTLRNKSERTLSLAGYFSMLMLFNLGFFFSYSFFHAWGAFGWYLSSAIAVGSIFKLRFAYYFPEHRYKKESRVVIIIAAVMGVGVFLDYAIQATLNDVRFTFNGHTYGSFYFSNVVPLVCFINFGWSIIVLGRQAWACREKVKLVRRSKGTKLSFSEKTSRFYYSLFPYRFSSQGRASWGFFALSIVELVVTGIYLINIVDPFFLQNTLQLIVNGIILLLFFFYMLLYLNATSEPTSFVAKLVGISLVTMMTVTSTLGLYDLFLEEASYEESRSVDVRRAIQAVEAQDETRIPENVSYIAIRDHKNSLFKVSYGKNLQKTPVNHFILPMEFYYYVKPFPNKGPGLHSDISARDYNAILGYFYVCYNVQRPGKTYQIGFNYRDYRQIIYSEASRHLLQVLTSTLIVLIVFPLFFLATITRPLKELLERLKGMAPGQNLNTLPESSDEIVLLSRSFNDIMGLLQEARERFSDYSEHLEQVENIVQLQSPEETITHKIGTKTLTYRSRVMREVHDRAVRFSDFKKPALITGETGTGKELIARLIHHSGKTQQGPFVAVNCAAIPAALWESEIFGHVRGAFTDARSSRQGKVQEAEKGSLFFDEIGEMPADMQAKMLRLLQENQFQAIGSEKTVNANCRFLFATNRNLERMVEEGTFREDLYYRINVFHVQLPPLRERIVDIPILVEHIVQEFSEEHGNPVPNLNRELLGVLMGYHWPGNIRELENVLIRAQAGDTPGVITLKDLPQEVLSQSKQPPGMESFPVAGEGFSQDLNMAFDERVKAYSRSLVESALNQSKGNKTKAAELLGIKRSRLRYQIKELGIEE